jgi:O-antigen ligase
MAAIAIGLSALIILAAVMPDQYRERFMTIGSVSADGTSGASSSGYGRIRGLLFGLDLMMQRPLTGVGIGNFYWYFGVAGEGFFKAHNMIGTLTGELGLLGVATFIYLIVNFMRNIKYVRMRYFQYGWKPDFYLHTAIAIKLGIILLFVQGLFSHNLLRMNWYVFGALSVVLANLIASRSKAEDVRLNTVADMSDSEAPAIEQKGL